MAKPAHDRNRTRENILTQATVEFASKGYDGARVDSIAERCGLSKNMLYHYFGSKDGLFVAVLERTYEILRARQGDLSLRALGPEEAMERLVEHTFWAFVENPDVIAILNSENLHQGRHIARSTRIQELYNPLVAMIRDVLARGAKEGAFRPGVDPIKLYISLASLAYHYISNQYTLQAALGIELTSREKQTEWLDHIKHMILAFCRNLDVEERSGQRRKPRARVTAQ
jgi:TetR/AcrR family transcriptional regulator